MRRGKGMTVETIITCDRCGVLRSESTRLAWRQVIILPENADTSRAYRADMCPSCMTLVFAVLTGKEPEPEPKRKEA